MIYRILALILLTFGTARADTWSSTKRTVDAANGANIEFKSGTDVVGSSSNTAEWVLGINGTNPAHNIYGPVTTTVTSGNALTLFHTSNTSSLKYEAGANDWITGVSGGNYVLFNNAASSVLQFTQGGAATIGPAGHVGNHSINGGITLTTDLAVADGGTGASNAASARTNLGLGSLSTLSAVSGGAGGTITDNTIDGNDISTTANITVGSVDASRVNEREVDITGCLDTVTPGPDVCTPNIYTLSANEHVYVSCTATTSTPRAVSFCSSDGDDNPRTCDTIVSVDGSIIISSNFIKVTNGSGATRDIKCTVLRVR